MATTINDKDHVCGVGTGHRPRVICHCALGSGVVGGRLQLPGERVGVVPPIWVLQPRGDLMAEGRRTTQLHVLIALVLFALALQQAGARLGAPIGYLFSALHRLPQPGGGGQGRSWWDHTRAAGGDDVELAGSAPLRRRVNGLGDSGSLDLCALSDGTFWYISSTVAFPRLQPPHKVAGAQRMPFVELAVNDHGVAVVEPARNRTVSQKSHITARCDSSPHLL